MAIPTLVNGQITDAVSQSTLTVLGTSGATAVAAVQQAASQSAGLRMQGAQAASGRLDMLRQAVVARAAARLMD